MCLPLNGNIYLTLILCSYFRISGKKSIIKIIPVISVLFSEITCFTKKME